MCLEIWCGLTLHTSLDDIERVDDERRYRASRQARDGLDERGRETRMSGITHKAEDLLNIMLDNTLFINFQF